MALGTGLVFSGLFDGHEQDQLGIAYAQDQNGAKYRAASGSTVANEKSFELTYRYLAIPGLVLQPMVQYLLNHSNDPEQNKSWWLGMRFEVTF
jgi:carbohydrate-selective porin OprB